MGIVWAARSDNANFDARYSPCGLRGGLLYSNVANIPLYEVDATAIGGNSYNLDQGAAAARAIIWPAHNVFKTAAWSILMRMKWTATGAYGILEVASGALWPSTNYLIIFNVSDWRLTLTNQTPATAISSAVISATPPANDVWVDVVFTNIGTTAANGVKVWIDGVNTGSLTAAVAQASPRDGNKTHYMSFGGIPGAGNARYRLNELVVWNEVINPASVALTSGTAALNGASRTAFVDVVSFDGTAASGGEASKFIGQANMGKG
jgi:hypothetical protein